MFFGRCVLAVCVRERDRLRRQRGQTISVEECEGDGEEARDGRVKVGERERERGFEKGRDGEKGRGGGKEMGGGGLGETDGRVILLLCLCCHGNGVITRHRQ